MAAATPQKTVPLRRPIKDHGGLVHAVVLREPTWDEVMTHGHPYSVHVSPEGAQIVVENHAAILAYAEACVVEPSSALCLSALGLHDTFAVRQAILDFFRTAEPGVADSNTSPETSSSMPASSPTP